jgi:hypothetical protein
MNNRLKRTIKNWETKVRSAINKAGNGVTIRGEFGENMICDLSDYIAVINLLKKGEIWTAYRKVVGMDTSAVENIPASVYNFLFRAEYK